VLVPGGSDAVRQLKSFVRAHPTVTAALQRWCDLAGMASGPIEARLMAPVAAGEPPDAVVSALRLPSGPGRTMENGQVLLRRVALACGAVVLVEALNWYVPERLPPDICDNLQSTNVPFGRAIEAIGVNRLDVVDLTAERGALFAQSAVVADRNGVRLAYVEETFLPSLLARHAA
ncbi:MAG: hypothetical protein K2Y05_02635, partial [Hyphomicrobiaceae bacterium]|nr:hypothetical protein [Hyphomicrobiaceae bacterium]